MFCPHENIEMQQVKVESHYGQPVILDQCPECGGIWFDYFEMYRVKQGQAEKIENLNVENLRISSPIKTVKLLCPKDHVELVRFKDVFFPKDIIIARCPVCNGFWLNKGEFVKYQNYRQSLKRPQEFTAEDEKMQKELERILAGHKTGDYTDTLGKLGAFLSTPVDNITWRPLEPGPLSGKENSVIDVIINTLSLILRSFVRI
jgi:Zn-finger nucleic acid-binding protein